MSNTPSNSAYPGLPLHDAATPARKLRVCIASFDFVGPVRNGGVGTAFTSLGEALAAAGHEVTLLYVSGQFCENGTLAQWIAYYKKKNITFVPMPATSRIPMDAPWHIVQSYQTYLWLLERQFDVVHFSEWKGPGYFALLAKHQGAAFSRTLLCVHTHGPTLWHKLSNSEFVTEAADVENDFVERASVKMADVVASPSYYLLDWMKEQAWELPPQCYVQQYVRPATARKPRPGSDVVQKIDELVFFGRLEHRKGLALFCDALDKLREDRQLSRLKVTFLGKAAEINGVSATEYLAKRARNWPWKSQVISDRDQAGAMDYLQGGKRLAVLPSLVDNLPNTVLECLGAAIPFIASNAGGIPEMIVPEDAAATLFDLRPAALAEKLRTVARTGIRPARTKVEPTANERAWVAWHEGLQAVNPSQSHSVSATLTNGQPLVSVCIAHWNRPEYLSQAIASIEAQDYPNLEVIVVDDCSSKPEAVAYLDSLEPIFQKRGWQLLRQTENRFPGAARNRAAKAARGEYILFMDDDNVAKPHEISTFVRVARKTGADILTCFLDTFSAKTSPAPEQKINSRILFLGGCVAAGLARNWFGDTNALMRREAFLALGGFHEQWGVNHEDYELMARAILRGYNLQVVPEPLVWYRINPGETSVIRNTPHHGNMMCSIRPYLENVPLALRNMVLLAQGIALKSSESGMVDAKSVNQYTQLTILWRSKLETGIALNRLHQREAAVNAMVEAVKSVETSRNPKAIFEALTAVGVELKLLDPKRSRLLLELALKLAKEINDIPGQEHAAELLNAPIPKGLDHLALSGNQPNSTAPIPKGLNHSAQGCAPRATLGTATDNITNPEWVESTFPNGNCNGDVQMRVSIIIPTFNNLNLTRQCLESLKKHTSPDSHEIVVVDNASTDGTAEFLRERETAAELRLIPNPKNLGFATACNQGAAAAKAAYILFLNNDTEVQPGWLDPLLKTLDADEQVAAVGGKLLYPDGTIQHAGVALADVKGRDPLMGFHLFAKEKSNFAMANECRAYPAVTAACVLVRKSLFAQAGGFDEGYWNGYEDLDLCLRFQESGYLTVYEPNCVVVHHESQSGPERFTKARENIQRLHKKWLGKIAADFVVEPDGKVTFSPNSKVRSYIRRALPAPPLLGRAVLLRRHQTTETTPSAITNPAVKPVADMPKNNGQTGVPKGQNDNSPAIHCRVQAAPTLSPEGTTDQKDGHHSSLPGTTHSSFSPSLPRSGGEAQGAVANPAVKAVADMPKSSGQTGVPKGQNDNSPAIHCRVQAGPTLSPEGTADQKDGHHSSPPGTTHSSFSPSLPRSGGEARGEEAPKQTSRTEPAHQLPLLHNHVEERAGERRSLLPCGVHGKEALPCQVSIIILAHNQLPDTRQCLASIEQHTPVSHELILVDNGSTDGTADFFRKFATTRKNVRVIINEKNLGFSGGNNQGLALARGANILLLNNDTVVTQGWLERMLGVFDRFPEVALVGPVSNCVSGPQLISPVKYKRLADLPSFAAQVAAANAGQTAEVPRLVGFCLLMRRAVVEKLGGLDERFGCGNFEDDDLCLRAGFAGFKLRIVGDSFVHHTGSQTFKGAKIDFSASMLRNWTLFKAKWGMPQNQPIENGYRVPQDPPATALAPIPLPDINSSHQCSPEGNVWTDTTEKSHAGQHSDTGANRDTTTLGRAALLRRQLIKRSGIRTDERGTARGARSTLPAEVAVSKCATDTGLPSLPAKQTSRTEPPDQLSPQLPLLHKFGGESWREISTKQDSRSEPTNQLSPQLPLLHNHVEERAGERRFLNPSEVHRPGLPSSSKQSVPSPSHHSNQVATSQKSTQPMKLPECALVGNLASARDLLTKKNLRAAWDSTIAAINSRPFHPEAHLLLAEIALAAADSVSARRCAQYASHIAPGFKPAKKFLKGNLRGNSRHEWLQLPPTISNRETKPSPSRKDAVGSATVPVALAGVPPANSLRLTVCLIAKNEEKFLGQCLASVRGLASQIILVDTGSTDRTVEIAREHGAEIHSFAWSDDFSAARNEALKRATGDWILNLDADEELLPEHRETILREIQEASVMAYRLPIIDKGREHEGCSYVPRLFRNAPGLFFVGRVHEQIFSSIEVRRGQWGLENRLGTAALLHHGYTSEIVVSREKIARNLRLLELAVQELPGEPNLLMNLGLELVRSGKLIEGLQQYREALKLISALPPEQVVPELRETLLTQLTSHLIKAGRFSEVLEVWRTPFAQSADMTASQHFLLGLACMELKQPQDAVTQMRHCLEKRGRRALTPVHGEIRKAAPNHCLALALAALKETSESEKAFRAALADEPDSRPLRFDFARFQADANQPLEALKILNQLVAEQPAETRVWQLGAQIAFSRPDFAEFARDWTGEAIKHCPHDTVIVLQRAESLLLNQEIEQSLPLWLKAHVSTSARHLAALVLCECVTGACKRAFSPSDEPLVSAEFQKWYQQLIKGNANSLVYQLNESMETIARVLPTFGAAWQRAMGSVRKPETELTATL